MRRVDVRPQDYCRDENDRYSVQIARGGKPLVGIKPERISSIEVNERLMTWNGANHIHGWFVDNVQNGKDDGREYRVSTEKLCELLEACENVLAGSHLVKKTLFEAKSYDPLSQLTGTSVGAPKVIKNVAAAHKWIPIRAVGSSWNRNIEEYGEAYLKDVEATRDWLELVLLDRKNGVPGEIYYQGS